MAGQRGTGGQARRRRLVKDRLLYVLDPDNRGAPPGFVLRVRKARVLKDGGYGRATSFFVNLHSTAKFMLPADQSILRESAQRSRYGEVFLKDRWASSFCGPCPPPGAATGGISRSRR